VKELVDCCKISALTLKRGSCFQEKRSFFLKNQEKTGVFSSKKQENRRFFFKKTGKSGVFS